MKTLEDKIIVYDSNCKVCTSFKDAILRLTTIPQTKVKALGELTTELIDHVDLEKFKNVMALINTSGGKTLYGSEGVAYILSSQYKIIDTAFTLKPIFNTFNFFYKTLAYNRYIIATPRSNFKCDCFPDKVVRFRVAYIAFAILLAVLLTAAFGLSLRSFFDGMSLSQAAFEMLLIAGTGWVIQIFLAITFLKDKALDYVGHLSSIMVVGLLVLVPWTLFHFVTGIRVIAFPAISVCVSSLFMLYMHMGRAKHLELSRRWTLIWFFGLQSTASFWIYFFHLK
jgi:predicted DCC family thiol-disulfide oxidoreductase YuxK